MRYRLEPRGHASSPLVIAVSLGAIVAALVVTGFIFMGFGHNPLAAYGLLIEATLSDRRGVSEVLRKTVPLLLCGVGLVLAFRMRFWNIGAEGQILAGAVGAAAVALFSPVSGPLTLPAMFVAGFLAGAAWGFLPALLKAGLGVNEIITTLMMNYIAFYLVQYLILGPWRGQAVRGFAYTDRFPPDAVLPLLAGTRLAWPMLFVAVVLVLLISLLLARTRLGFEIRVIGQSRAAASYAGMGFTRVTLLVIMISAGAAGLAGVGEVAGVHYRLLDPGQISLGYGYTAIIVALLARGNPLATLLTATFLGLVFAMGDVMRVVLGLPFQMTGVISGLVLFFMIAAEPLIRYRLRRVGVAKGGAGWSSRAG
ncbi:MAG: ABC transporter permease [Deinococcota bacterium]|nr:ABC transporter permease [Deinococcota bacterium]